MLAVGVGGGSHVGNDPGGDGDRCSARADLLLESGTERGNTTHKRNEVCNNPETNTTTTTVSAFRNRRIEEADSTARDKQ